MQGILSIENLTVDFPNIRALDNISLRINEGDIFGFLGPNGAGKTTTIKVLLGLLKPSLGTAKVMGYSIAGESSYIRQNSGVLLEHNGLYETISAQDNLEYYARIWNIPYLERRARIKTLLSEMDLWDRRKDSIGDWSKGMKQKLAIARCFIHRPNLVFLDEPTSGLDPVAVALFRTQLLNLAKNEGTTVFLTTHNLEEAEKICNKFGVILNGKIIGYGSSDDLKNDHRRNCYEIKIKELSAVTKNRLLQDFDKAIINFEYDNNSIYAEFSSPEFISAFVSKIIDEGGQITEVKNIQPSLEQVYLEIMNENNK